MLIKWDFLKGILLNPATGRLQGKITLHKFFRRAYLPFMPEKQKKKKLLAVF